MSRYNSSEEGYLFHKGDWHATQRDWREKLLKEIESKNGDELLNTSTNDLAKHYADSFSLDVPLLNLDELVVDQREVKIDVSRDNNRWIEDRSRPYYVTGTLVEVEVPFSGNKVGFEIQPSMRNLNNPKAYIGNGVLRFSISGSNLTEQTVKSEILKRVESINQYLEWLSRDATGYNEGLLDLAIQTIEQRKSKLLKDKSLLAGLGFKMKARPGQSETFAAPVARRNIRPIAPMPSASRNPFKPEPTLPIDDYEHILSVLRNMVSVMEQSPGRFQRYG
jgi:hypothetical protein